MPSWDRSTTWWSRSPAGKADFSGEMASELRALMDSNTVRMLDLVLLSKDLDGSVEAAELAMPTTARSGSCARRRPT